MSQQMWIITTMLKLFKKTLEIYLHKYFSVKELIRSTKYFKFCSICLSVDAYLIMKLHLVN